MSAPPDLGALTCFQRKVLLLLVNIGEAWLLQGPVHRVAYIARACQLGAVLEVSQPGRARARSADRRVNHGLGRALDRLAGLGVAPREQPHGAEKKTNTACRTLP